MSKKFIIAVSTFLFAMSFCAFSGESILMKAVGTKQGAFNGGVLMKGFEKTSAVTKYTFSTKRSSNNSKSQTPFTVLKKWDSASAQYLTAFSNDEVLSEVTISFIFPVVPGQLQFTKIYKLTNAKVIDYNDNVYIENSGYLDSESISFSYEKIELIKDGIVLWADGPSNVNN